MTENTERAPLSHPGDAGSVASPAQDGAQADTWSEPRASVAPLMLPAADATATDAIPADPAAAGSHPHPHPQAPVDAFVVGAEARSVEPGPETNRPPVRWDPVAIVALILVILALAIPAALVAAWAVVRSRGDAVRARRAWIILGVAFVEAVLGALLWTVYFVWLAPILTLPTS